ncbi:unnamed protein product [Arctia plantaginis]|uniref:Zinc phosphodiesterase ELAC protein 2 n=1 Tax=Arctia plantaginis TaxID=874455 RepID=A0A8S1B4J1_ARCPL|nr:unnamed protein product [Arctia plantaginis]
MPKANSERIASAQRQRQQISKKGEKYGPSTVYLQVLGSGAKGAPNTLYLFTDQKRYMFNCGECTQRLAHEHKVKLSKLDHIFITSKTWKNIGGLPGLSLTLQDVGVPNITLHGPEGLDELYNATKRFVIMKDMNITMAKSSPTEDFEDNVMTVKYVLLGPLDNLLNVQPPKPAGEKSKHEFTTEKEFEEFIHDDTDYYNTNKNVVNHKEKQKYQNMINYTERVDTMKFKAEKFLKNLQKHVDCSVAYICTLKKRLGTLDLAKCVELGVKPGPLLGQLKSGMDVVLPNGNLVLSKDVKTPDDPGPVFIVLDVPHPSYIQESDFKAHFDNGINPRENIPALVVHFTPPHVFHHPAYTALISKFGPTTQHLILNGKNSCLGSEAVHRTQHKLHLLDPDIFPLLRDVSVPAVWTSQSPLPKADSPIKMKCLEELKNKIACAQFQNIFNLEGSVKGDAPQAQENGDSLVKQDLFAGRTLTMYHLRPNRQIDRSVEPKLHIQDYIQETLDVGGFAGSLEQFRRVVDGIRYAKSETVEYPKVVFLGTGSCIPSKTRNTSAIVIHVDESRSILLDCGEGTYGQMVRFYGPKKVNAFLKTLKAVYVSHLHADHHIGLIGVLQARRQAFEESLEEHHVPVFLLAPGQIVTWLTLYDNQFENIKDNYTLIPNQSLLEEAESSSAELSAAALAAIGVQSVRTCRVAHCPNAFGVALLINGEKITYSGDTLPCDDLVKLGENSTLLIHEATMEDELADEARTKMHSTTTQAIEMGRRMNARFTVLTHFSQRYARLPRLNANILNNNNTVGIAFDNMQITMNDLELLPHMYAPLQLMFADHCVEMELKAAHRQLREKRDPSPGGTHTPKRMRDLKDRTHHTGDSSHANKRSKNHSMKTVQTEASSHATSEILTHALEAIQSEGTHTHTDQKADVSKDDNSVEDSVKASGSITGNSSTPVNFKRHSSPCRTIISAPPASFKKGPAPSKKEIKLLDNIYRAKAIISWILVAVEQKHTDHVLPQKIKQLTQKATLQNQNVSGLRQAILDKTVGIKSNRSKPAPSVHAILSQQANFSSNSNNGSTCQLNQEMKSRMRSDTMNKSPVAKQPRSRSSSLTPSNRRNQSQPRFENAPHLTKPRAPLDRTPVASMSMQSTELLECENNGYGKPLVTPIHKKLVIRRDGVPNTPIPTQGKLFKNNPVWNSSSNLNTVSKIPVLKNNYKLKAYSASTTSQNIAKPNVGGSTGSSKCDVQKARAIMHSSIKNYKPQLEDIKSSYLLLNKHGQAAQLKTGENKARLPKLSKPIPLNEELRQKQLLEAKSKFSSKRFLSDSKYDKIEGLNWITWK